jgi:HlyD family secretion protein
MKRKIILGCLLPLLFVGGGIWWGIRVLKGAPDPPARYETVGRGDVEIKVTETGAIEPLKKVEVKSKVAGRIAKLYAQEGDRVRAGQLLAVIDPTEINSQVAQMRAQLEGAKARLEASRRGVLYQGEQTKASIGQMRENLKAAEARLKMAQEEDRAQPGLSAGELAEAQAAHKAAQDNLTLLKESTHPQAVVQAQSGYEETKASAENARHNLERQQRLLQKGFVSEQVVDQARSDMAAANARLDQAKKRLELIEGQNRLEIANAESRVAEAKATLDRAKANQALIAIKNQEALSAQAVVAQARAQLQSALSGTHQDRIREDEAQESQASVTQLENMLREIEVRQHDTQLVATMGGVVTKRYIEQGELVTSGVSTFSTGTPVMQIADLSQMLVKMTVNEVDVHKVRPALPVEIAIDGVKGEMFRGRVRKVSPAAVGGPGEGGGNPGGGGVIRFAVEVLVDRPDPRLKPGMSARCTIVIDRKKNVLRLPNNCVEGEGAKAKAQVVTVTHKDGKPVDTAAPRPVVAGLRGDSHVEIVSGLKEGERVKPGAYTGPKRKAMDLNFE